MSTPTLGPAEPFTVEREHLLEYMLDETRLALARQKVATAEAMMREARVEVAFREREFRLTARRLDETYAGEGHVITKAIDLGTGIGERRRVVPAEAVEPVPPPNGSAEEAEEKLGATIAAGA